MLVIDVVPGKISSFFSNTHEYESLDFDERIVIVEWHRRWDGQVG
jgi:hypothetical protein